MRFAYITLSFLLSSCVWETSSQSGEDYLPLDDSEYPYANIPRLVIETDDFRQVKNESENIPAHFQLYGKSGPESGIVGITIRGRGNSSFKMPKYGFKINLERKYPVLGMPASKDWVLVANFRDKTHIKNFISFALASNLGDDYVARNQFVELFVNRKYMGLYQIMEQVKVAKKRVNIGANDFLIEKTTNKSDGPHFTSKNGLLFNIKNPSNPSEEDTLLIKKHIDEFESFIQSKKWTLSQLEKWVDLDDLVRFYWVQELSKNLDGKLQRSVFVTWERNGLIKMGPVWDFDLAYGIGMVSVTTTPEGWEIRKKNWYKWLWQNSDFAEYARDYWIRNRDTFVNLLPLIDSISIKLYPAVNNDNSRWPVLNTTENLYHEVAFSSYTIAIDNLKMWIKRRIYWIDSNL